MVKEYIERGHAVDAVLDVYCDTPNIDLSCEKFEAAILKIPAADVAVVQHGRWVFGKDLACCWGQILKNKYHLYCSECLEQAFNRSEDNDPDFDIDTPYCPNCGAKMDKEVADDKKQPEEAPGE